MTIIFWSIMVQNEKNIVESVHKKMFLKFATIGTQKTIFSSFSAKKNINELNARKKMKCSKTSSIKFLFICREKNSQWTWTFDFSVLNASSKVYFANTINMYQHVWEQLKFYSMYRRNGFRVVIMIMPNFLNGGKIIC